MFAVWPTIGWDFSQPQNLSWASNPRFVRISLIPPPRQKRKQNKTKRFSSWLPSINHPDKGNPFFPPLGFSGNPAPRTYLCCFVFPQETSPPPPSFFQRSEVSGKTGQGVPGLVEAIIRKVPPPPGAGRSAPCDLSSSHARRLMHRHLRRRFFPPLFFSFVFSSFFSRSPRYECSFPRSFEGTPEKGWLVERGQKEKPS